MNIKKQSLLSVGLAGLLSLSSFASSPILAQDGNLLVDDVQSLAEDAPIKIINRDGEAVDSAELGKGNNAQPAKAAGIPRVRIHPGMERLGAGAMIRNNNGKITIIDSNGEKKEIDVEGARSVSISHSSKTVVVDGVRKHEVVGKAIVVGADGERNEYNLAPPEAGAEGPMPGFQGTFRAGKASNDFMIGVNCRAVSDLLAAQLQLEPDTGLVVQSVSKDSPAAQAGIKKHDILMFAEDRGLSKISDLNDVVNKAGKEDTKVSLTVIRGGKEIGIDVGVVERPNQGINSIAGFPEIPGLDFEFRQALPGIMIDDNFRIPRPKFEMGGARFEGLDERIDQMREQMDQLREQMQQQHGIR